MLVKMKKASLIGLAQYSNNIVTAVQNLGVVDVIQLNDDYDSSRIDKLQSEKNSILTTIKYLAANQSEEETVKNKKSPAEIIQRTTTIRARLDEMQEERRKRLRQIDIWSLFGDFDPQKVQHLIAQGINVQFFQASESVFSTQNEDFTNHDVIIITKKAQKIYFCTFGFTPLESTRCEEIPLPDFGLNGLRQQLQNMADEKKALEAELFEMSLAKQDLARQWVETENQFSFQRAIAQQVINDELFYLQGWVPENKVAELKTLSDEQNFILLLEEPKADESPPTTHKNKIVGEIGESLIYIYDAPSYRDIDPSSTVFIFFALFFGMIIADVGYGVVLLLLTLGLFKGQSKSMQLFRKLSITVSCTTILFGILTASYFAVGIDPDTALGKLVYLLAPLYRDTSQKDGLMSSMFISLWIGVVNLSWVNLYKVWHEKKWSALGWIPALVGLIPLFKLLFGMPWEGWENVVGLWPLYGGVLFVATLTAIETRASFGGKMGAFAYSLYTVVQLIADLLSFLRIFALAMAGAKMAETFNMLFGMILEGGGLIMGLTVGVFVLIIGHVINLVLNIMGGVIHGLRLNFIESYHWCLDGGGKQYQPLRYLKYESE